MKKIISGLALGDGWWCGAGTLKKGTSKSQILKIFASPLQENQHTAVNIFRRLSETPVGPKEKSLIESMKVRWSLAVLGIVYDV